MSVRIAGRLDGRRYQGLRPGEALALADTSIRDRTLLVESNISLGEEKDTKTHRIRNRQLPAARAAGPRRLPARHPS